MKPMTIHFRCAAGSRRGFTIVEIVMAFIIIGILTAVLVPSLTKRAAEARLKACQTELERLADAEERAAVDTGYYYRPYVLNDVPGIGDNKPSAPKDPTQITNPSQQNRVDSIRDNSPNVTGVSGNIYDSPSHIFIYPTGNNVDFLPTDLQDAKFTQLTGVGRSAVNDDTDYEGKFGWNGPYVNWSRDENRNDWPEDPWGNDYLLFLPGGVIYPPNFYATDTNLKTDHSYQLNEKGPKWPTTTSTTEEYPAKGIFDRPTWVSLGPDGLVGSGGTDTSKDNYGYGKGDDLVRPFGTSGLKDNGNNTTPTVP